jgi:hypothetical protein
MEEVRNGRGERLHCIFHDKATDAVVIMAHGTIVDCDWFFFPAMAEALPISVCRFDFSGCGRSEGVIRPGGI